jgi:hypothetical protein
MAMYSDAGAPSPKFLTVALLLPPTLAQEGTDGTDIFQALPPWLELDFGGAPSSVSLPIPPSKDLPSMLPWVVAIVGGT